MLNIRHGRPKEVRRFHGACNNFPNSSWLGGKQVPECAPTAPHDQVIVIKKVRSCSMGRLDEAVTELERARDLDPFSIPIKYRVGPGLPGASADFGISPSPSSIYR